LSLKACGVVVLTSESHLPRVVSMSVRGATGGTCPAVKSVKHEEKQSNVYWTCINVIVEE
jgi:hypothetical protein